MKSYVKAVSEWVNFRFTGILPVKYYWIPDYVWDAAREATLMVAPLDKWEIHFTDREVGELPGETCSLGKKILVEGNQVVAKPHPEYKEVWLVPIYWWHGKCRVLHEVVEPSGSTTSWVGKWDQSNKWKIYTLPGFKTIGEGAGGSGVLDLWWRENRHQILFEHKHP